MCEFSLYITVASVVSILDVDPLGATDFEQILSSWSSGLSNSRFSEVVELFLKKVLTIPFCLDLSRTKFLRKQVFTMLKILQSTFSLDT